MFLTRLGHVGLVEKTHVQPQPWVFFAMAKIKVWMSGLLVTLMLDRVRFARLVLPPFKKKFPVRARAALLGI